MWNEPCRHRRSYLTHGRTEFRTSALDDAKIAAEAVPPTTSVFVGGASALNLCLQDPKRLRMKTPPTAKTFALDDARVRG
jgi:hypothetical protein